MNRTKLRLVAAFLAGLVGVFAFPPFGIWPLAFVSIAGFSVIVQGRSSRQGAWLGLLFGAGLFLPMLHWTATYVGSVPWLVLVFSQTWYTALLGAAMPRLQRLRCGAFFAAAAAWYRRFLNRASPNRPRPNTPTSRRPDGKVARKPQQRPMLARRR